MKKNCFELLPPEVLLLIFERFKDQDLIYIRLTCKQFNDSISDKFDHVNKTVFQPPRFTPYFSNPVKEYFCQKEDVAIDAPDIELPSVRQLMS